MLSGEWRHLSEHLSNGRAYQKTQLQKSPISFPQPLRVQLRFHRLPTPSPQQQNKWFSEAECSSPLLSDSCHSFNQSHHTSALGKPVSIIYLSLEMESLSHRHDAGEDILSLYKTIAMQCIILLINRNLQIKKQTKCVNHCHIK